MKNVKENKRRWKQLVAIFIVAVMLFTTPHIVGFASMGKEEATTATADGNPDNSDVKVQSEDADSEEDIQTESLDASEQSESSEEKTTEKKTETTEAEKKTGADESKKEKAEAYREKLGDNGIAKNLNDLPSSAWEAEIDVLAATNATAIKESKASAEKTGSTGATELPLGVYLVKETTTPAGYVASKPFIVSVPSTDNYDTAGKEGTEFIYNITAKPKNSKMSVDKTIVNEDKTAYIGGFVEYKVETQIPKYGTEYTNPVFNIYDKMSNGLSFVNDAAHKLKVFVGGTEIVERENTYTLATNGLSDEKTFEIQFAKAFLENKENKGKKVEVTYYAQVNKNAVYINENSANITYQNKPGETTDATPSEKNVYTYGIDLTKKGDKSADADGLDGAEFTLAAANGEMISILVNGTKVDVNGNSKDKFRTTTVGNKKGKLVFKGLKAGTYTLTETKSPSGYSLAKNPITIVITAKEDGSLADATVDGISVKNNMTEDGVVPVGLQNKSGFNLPATGGMGTYLFTIGGLVIMAGAALLLIASKKRRA